MLETNSSINTGPSIKIHHVYNFLSSSLQQHCCILLIYFFMSSPSSVHLIIFMIRVDDAHLSHLALKSEMMCKHQLFREPALILQKEARGWVNRES